MSVVTDTDDLAPVEDATPAPAGSDAPAGRPRRFRRVLRDPGVIIAGSFLFIVVAVALLAPVIAPYEPYAQDVVNRFGKPSRDHLLGTDSLGRDVLSRLMYGARVSLKVSLIVVGVGLAIAVPLGLLIGYRRGRLDNIVMRFVDAGLSVPPMVLALAVAGVRGPGVNNAILALTIVVVPGMVRFVRGQARAISEDTYIRASRSIGTSTARLLATRVLRNVTSPLLVQIAYLLGSILIVEAGLSYLGLGAQPPEPSWGNMLRDAYNTALFTDGWLLVIPGAAIAFTVLAFNELSDGLRDAVASTGRSQSAIPRGARRGITSVRSRGDREGIGQERVAAPALLEIDDLRVEVVGERSTAEVVRGLSLSIPTGSVLGLAGESGSGKTVTAMSVLRLLPTPPFEITGGSIRFDGRDLLQMSLPELRRVRGAEIGVVFQNPMTSLDPAQTIGQRLIQAQRVHRDVTRSEARRRAIELLDRVRIPSAAARLDDYPHQLSGGMLQRVMISIALVNEPRLLIADEPTTALDVTVQDQILGLLRELQSDLGVAMLFVTHDLGVIADLCDRVAVMYAGELVEQSTVDELFARPKHPYTEGLMRATPHAALDSNEPMWTIPGTVPPMSALPRGCKFAPRCTYAIDACRQSEVASRPTTGGEARCIRADELSLEGAQ